MKRFYFPLIIFIIFFATQCFGQDITYQHKISLDQVTFEWSVDSNLIHIKLTGKTTGWVGIGFNPVQAMKGANFVLGYVKDGKAVIKNQYGDQDFHHTAYKNTGSKNEITDVSGKVTNGVTEIAFTMPLKSEIHPNNIIKPNEETTVLLAHGPGMKSLLIKHQFKTKLKVNLSTGDYKKLD